MVAQKSLSKCLFDKKLNLKKCPEKIELPYSLLAIYGVRVQSVSCNHDCMVFEGQIKLFYESLCPTQ